MTETYLFLLETLSTFLTLRRWCMSPLTSMCPSDSPAMEGFNPEDTTS